MGVERASLRHANAPRLPRGSGPSSCLASQENLAGVEMIFRAILRMGFLSPVAFLIGDNSEAATTKHLKRLIEIQKPVKVRVVEQEGVFLQGLHVLIGNIVVETGNIAEKQPSRL
jgi:hypothetical protein